MEKAEHAAKLRRAMAEQGVSRDAVADYVGVAPRSVTNWTSEKKPMMPGPVERAALRRLLGDYDMEGDPVEVAIERSTLIRWRRDELKAAYQRHLYEQAREEAG